MYEGLGSPTDDTFEDGPWFRFKIFHLLLLTTVSAVLFGIGRTIALQSWIGLFALVAGVVFVVSSWFFVARQYRSPLDMMLTVYLTAFFGCWFGWSVWHSASFTISMTMFTYFIAVWLGATPRFELHDPSVGVPLYLLLMASIWWGHSGPHGHLRPLTMVLPVIASAPFMMCVVYRMLRLH